MSSSDATHSIRALTFFYFYKFIAVHITIIYRQQKQLSKHTTNNAMKSYITLRYDCAMASIILISVAVTAHM